MAVADILRSGSRNTQDIVRTQDSVLDSRGDDGSLRLYLQLCGNYFTCHSTAASGYIDAYREMYKLDVGTEAIG